LNGGLPAHQAVFAIAADHEARDQLTVHALGIADVQSHVLRLLLDRQKLRVAPYLAAARDQRLLEDALGHPLRQGEHEAKRWGQPVESQLADHVTVSVHRATAAHRQTSGDQRLDHAEKLQVVERHGVNANRARVGRGGCCPFDDHRAEAVLMGGERTCQPDGPGADDREIYLF
jgi:hypothetical protein